MRRPTIGSSAKAQQTVWTVHPDAGVAEALAKMDRHQIHHLAVVDQNVTLGVVGDRDILWRSLVKGTGNLNESATVRSVMRPIEAKVTESTTLADALQMMRELNTSALPVFESNTLTGILTETDLIRYMDNLLAGDQSEKRPERDSVSIVDRGTVAFGNPLVQEVMNLLAEAGI